MARRKKLTRDEILARKRAAEKARRDKIKLNPEIHAMYKEKEKQRYQKRKEDKKLVQINDMTPRQKRNQRKKWKINSKNYRDRQRYKAQLEQRLAENSPPDTDSEDAVSEAINISEKQPEALAASKSVSQKRPFTRSVGGEISDELVMLDTSRICNTPKSNVSPSVKRKLRYNTSKKLLWYKKQLQDLKKQNEMLRKRLFRSKNMNRMQNSDSPKTKVEHLLSDPNKKEDVKKALVFAETIKNNLTINYENLKTHKQKKEFKENIQPACKTLKKYKILKDLKYKMVRKVTEQKKLPKTKNRIHEDIKSFFECDDNSRMAAGKRDCITRKMEKKQKRFLVDSLMNLHKKFLETHQYTVSYSVFCKNKPFWVIAPVEKDRETCMCKLHENVTLLAQALWKNKIIREKSSSEVLSATVCNNNNLACLERKCLICINKIFTVMEFDNSKEILYWIWESGTKEINTKGQIKTIKTTVKKKHKNSPKIVIELLMNHMQKFYIHCANITNQYKCTTTLKKQLESNEVTVHMDFSENYSTKYNTEIQSLHFGGSRNQISLHTSVVYAPGLEPQSFCTYSDCLRHDALAVWGHLVPILKFIDIIVPDIDTLHIITDSTCSQYRNKSVNYIITKLHWYLKNLKCVTWNYTEAGHGKGAPDGVGATLKRTADQIVRYGKDIPDINTFGTEMKKTVKNVHLEYISEYDIYEKEYFMPLTQVLKPFKGMLQVHQIIWNKNNENTIVLRRQSCVSGPCKNQAVICIHGKHMGFYDLHVSSSLPQKQTLEKRPEASTSYLPSDVVPLHRSRKFIATRNIELPIELQDINTNNTLEKQPEASVSYLSSDVVPLHRSQKFIATRNIELPIELQEINTNNSNIILEPTIMNAESLTMQDIINSSDGSNVGTSRVTPDLNFNHDFNELVAEDAKSMANTLQDDLLAPTQILKSCSFFDIELFHGNAHYVSEDPKSPSKLAKEINVPQPLESSTQEEVYKPGSWVIISYQVKKTTKYFIGQIINTNGDGTYVVKFLRRLKGTTNIFTWPQNEDEDSVPKDSIKKMLKEPNINRRGQLLFDDIQDLVLE